MPPFLLCCCHNYQIVILLVEHSHATSRGVAEKNLECAGTTALCSGATGRARNSGDVSPHSIRGVIYIFSGTLATHSSLVPGVDNTAGLSKGVTIIGIKTDRHVD